MDLDQNRNFSCSSERWRVNIGRSASKTNFSSLGDIEYRMLILDRRRMKKKGDENDFQNFYEILFNREFEHASMSLFQKRKKKKNFLNDANSSVENIYIFIETCLQKEIRSSTKNSFVEMNNPHTRDEKRSFRASLVARTQGAPSTKLFLNRARVEEPTRVIA